MSHTSLVRPPKQTRSRRTLERIVKASLAILEEDGPDIAYGTRNLAKSLSQCQAISAGLGRCIVCVTGPDNPRFRQILVHFCRENVLETKGLCQSNP